MTYDERLLRRAIGLAAKSRADGNPPFGSLLADSSGEVLAEDHNTSISDNDITAHPELKLARWAARELTPELAAKATMYTSCQPCGMCTGAIERSGLGRIVFALSNDQLSELKPPATKTDAILEGPALFTEASIPVMGYYD